MGDIDISRMSLNKLKNYIEKKKMELTEELDKKDSEDSSKINTIQEELRTARKRARAICRAITRITTESKK